MRNLKKKSIISFILIMTMVFNVIPFGVFNSSVYAVEDNREEISAIEGTSTDIDTIAGYGKEIQMPTITTTTGMPAYFNVSNMRFVGKEKCRRWMEYSEYWHIYRRNI